MQSSFCSGTAVDFAAGISVVIPTWNGLELLCRNLPSVITSAEHYKAVTGFETEILVIDDSSRDETAAEIPARFPEICLIRRAVNGGFAAACNTGFHHSRFPLVALLNNDVRIDPEYLFHHARHFQDPDVFAVTAKVYEWDSTTFATGGRVGRFRRGFWSVYFNYDVLPSGGEWIHARRLLSAYAIGGFATYDRLKLKELGGFNELLAPFHWEDVDLSYRGWKRGWKIKYEPRSIAYHRASSTIDAHFHKRYVEMVSLRNRLLFHWIHLHSQTLFASHIAVLMALMLSRLLVLDYGFYYALFSALRQWGTVRRLRSIERRQAKRSDRDIIKELGSFYRSAPIEIYYNQREVLDKHPDRNHQAR
ncbi:MAG: glycosyltransferase [Acidobacteria bacterium]|nr:glycosyltransferase [Acidobacteriota bacterium]